MPRARRERCRFGWLREAPRKTKSGGGELFFWRRGHPPGRLSSTRMECGVLAPNGRLAPGRPTRVAPGGTAPHSLDYLLWATREADVRLLVVEDEPELRRVVAQALREAGYAVDEAADGRDGLYKATTWAYDAIVLDLMLPHLDGWSVLAALRRAHKTPVLILTARDTLGDVVRGLDGGADDYLIKPFRLAELLARLRALVRRGAGQPATQIVIGDVSIDSTARVVRRGAEVVPLTAREYALVELLALHRGKLVSRSEIYDHLFDENEDSLSNLVDVHVSNIRKKLGHDFILTRRGQGYVVDA